MLLVLSRLLHDAYRPFFLRFRVANVGHAATTALITELYRPWRSLSSLNGGRRSTPYGVAVVDPLYVDCNQFCVDSAADQTRTVLTERSMLRRTSISTTVKVDAGIHRDTKLRLRTAREDGTWVVEAGGRFSQWVTRTARRATPFRGLIM